MPETQDIIFGDISGGFASPFRIFGHTPNKLVVFFEQCLLLPFILGALTQGEK